MAGQIRQNAVIAVTGPTGTGKSLVAVHLARRFNGEIVNADALQIYSGLPIATNKLGIDEMRSIKHHLLGCIDVHEPPWTVTEYVYEARKIIRDIHSRGKLPIIVGGTHYYIFSLLQRDSLISDDVVDELPSRGTPFHTSQMDTESMLRELQKLDPVAASWWHPRDGRKIRRSLEICLKTGRKVSEIHEAQRAARRARNEGMDSLEYDALCIYLHADREQLRSRLDARVENMIRRGLLDEVEFMRQRKSTLENENINIDFSRGIWIAIGFKEFKTYLEALSIGQSTESLQAEKDRGCERTKISTHQYAVKQMRYVKYKILPLFQTLPEEDRFHILDASNFENGLRGVMDNAGNLTHRFLNRQPLDTGTLIGLSANAIFGSSLPSVKKSNTCEICNITTTTVKDWERHLHTTKHKKATRRFENDMKVPM